MSTGPQAHRDHLRLGVRIFLSLLAINAAIGMLIVIGGDMGDRGWQVLTTSVSLTVGVMLGLACATARGNRELGPLWAVGIGAAFTQTATWIGVIWATPDSESPWQAAGTLTTCAIAVACSALLGSRRLPDRWRWMTLLTYLVVGMLAVLTIVAIWGGGWDTGVWQFYGVLSIALATLAIAIPVVHRTSARELAHEATSSTPPEIGFCPHCAAPVVAVRDQAVHCTRCARTFTVRMLTT